MEAQINQIEKEARELVSSLSIPSYTKNGIEYVRLSLDGRKGTFEISFELSRALGIKWKNGLAEIPKARLEGFLIRVAKLYLEQRPDIPFPEYIRGDKSHEELSRTGILGGQAWMGRKGTEASLSGGVGIERTTKTDKQSLSIKGILGSEAGLSASLGWNNYRFSLQYAGSFRPGITATVTGFPISYVPGLGLSTPLHNPVTALVVSAIQRGFMAASQGKDLLDGAIRAVGWATGIGPAVEAARENFQDSQNILSSLWTFVKTFVEFWVEMIRNLVVSFVEALDYLVALLTEPEKQEIKDEKHARAIIEKISISKARNNTEEMENYVKAYRGRGPLWFRGEMYFWEDVALQDNYGLFKSPLAPWRWFQDPIPRIKEREAEAIEFLRAVIEGREPDPEYVERWGGFDKALVGTVIYLRLKLQHPQYLHTDRDVIEQLLYDTTPGAINSVPDIVNRLIRAALTEEDPIARAHTMFYLRGYYPTDPQLVKELSPLEKFLLGNSDVEISEEEFLPYLSIHFNPALMIAVFEKDPKMGWRIWQGIKKNEGIDHIYTEMKEGDSSWQELTTTLGMDHTNKWSFLGMKSRLEHVYQAYKEGKPARFVALLQRITPEELFFGYFFWEDWNKVMELTIPFYNDKGEFGITFASLEYLKRQEGDFAEHLYSHIKENYFKDM